MAVFATGCSGGAAEAPAIGTALGPGASYETGIEKAQAGDSLWFAFPVLVNTSSDDIEVVGAEVTEVPDSIKITRYAAFDKNDTDGLALNLRDADLARLDPKDQWGETIRVKAHSESNIFYMARLAMVKSRPSIVAGCRVKYRQGGRLYVQDQRCKFLMGTTG
ncbi:hypothetical protein [Streptomyces sp. NPDC086023]|uniref:hypothetical protein n=1 Tax=Streptomyces sp. NPDC086023 TaxID=3365746 RepID=UPI0037CF9DAE